MRDVFTITLLSKQYYQISYQLIKNPILQIMSYTKLEKSRDIKHFVCTIFMNLSKAFGYVPHDLLAVKLHGTWFIRGCSNFCKFILKT